MNKEILLKTKELAKDISVLYVEDEKEIRDVMGGILKEFFDNIHIASNGQEGIELFKSQSIDMILTDIEMPIMSGLEMSKRIREISYDVPIGIISAFNEVEKFTQAIRYGVNRYMLKPIEQENVINTLYGMLSDLNNKTDAKRYHKKLQQEQISKAVETTADYFLQSIPSPVFVVDENRKILYLNEFIIEMLEQKDIKVQIGDNVKKIESVFIFDSGEKISIDMIEDKVSHNKRVIFKDENSNLFFVPCKQDVEIPTIEGMSSIILLNDVTLQMKQLHVIEYQKEKLQANREILEEFLNENIFKVPDKQKEKAKEIVEKNEFNKNEELLRRTHIYKISAKDYMTTLSETIEDDLDELNESELDLQSELYEFEYSQKIETLRTISNLFRNYTKPLIRLIEFSDLADAVEAVASYLEELTQEHVDSNAYMIKVMLQSVLDDLTKWEETVFVTQSTDDIHYLDSSLYNTILELQNLFNEKSEDEQVEDNEDELEFF